MLNLNYIDKSYSFELSSYLDAYKLSSDKKIINMSAFNNLISDINNSSVRAVYIYLDKKLFRALEDVQTVMDIDDISSSLFDILSELNHYCGDKALAKKLVFSYWDMDTNQIELISLASIYERKLPAQLSLFSFVA